MSSEGMQSVTDQGLTSRARWMGQCLLIVAVVVGCNKGDEIIVFHAASLARSFFEIGESFHKAYPRHRLRMEVSGSQTAARKLTELHMRADVIAVADAEIIARMLMPRHASWSVDFCTNEIVVAHKDHSRYTERITKANWLAILQRPDVKLGCVDENLAPIGYRTLMLWQLAAVKLASGEPATSFARRLRARCAPEHVMPDEGKLLGLLSARVIDYAMMYRSTAEEHHLKLTALPGEYNLGKYDLASLYRQAAVQIQLDARGTVATMRGAPIRYGVTIPRSAPNQPGAEAFVRFLLGEHGVAILRRRGFTPLTPATARPLHAMPGSLRPMVMGAPEFEVNQPRE